MRVVSTFPLGHASIYGERFLKDCKQYGILLTLACYEPFHSVPWYGESRMMGQHDVELRDFQHDCRLNFKPTQNYRFQAERFAFKVFAMTNRGVRDSDWIVWLDADVRMHGSPDWEILLHDESDVSYLGRSEWDHSESGFLAFNMKKRGGEALDALRSMYTSRSIFLEHQWHDAYLFDRVRDRLELKCHNLSPDAKDLDAWEASPLINWSRHLKGNRKFTESECVPNTSTI